MFGLILICALADCPETLQPKLDWLLKHQEALLVDYEKQVKELQVREKKALKKERDKIRATLKEIKQTVEAIKEGDIKPPHSSLQNMKVGDVGEHKVMHFEVLSILDPETMLVIPWTDLSSSGRWDTVMLRGWPTKGMVDGQLLKPLGWTEVVGTKAYNALGGRTTVFVLSPFPIDKLKPFLREKK